MDSQYNLNSSTLSASVNESSKNNISLYTSVCPSLNFIVEQFLPFATLNTSMKTIQLENVTTFRDLAKLAVIKEIFRLQGIVYNFKWVEEVYQKPRLITAWDIDIINSTNFEVVVMQPQSIKRVSAISTEKIYGRGLVSMVNSQPTIICIQDSEKYYILFPNDLNYDLPITNDYVCNLILTSIGNPMIYNSGEDIDNYFDKIKLKNQITKNQDKIYSYVLYLAD